MYLVDTNVVSELRKVHDGRADPAVVDWFSVVDAGHLHLSVVSIMEIEMGIARIDRRNPDQAAILRRWLHENVEPGFDGRLLPITRDIAARCGPLHVPRTRGQGDAWIAATALVHNLVVVTRNVVDFEGTGVAVVNPWIRRPD